MIQLIYSSLFLLIIWLFLFAIIFYLIHQFFLRVFKFDVMTRESVLNWIIIFILLIASLNLSLIGSHTLLKKDRNSSIYNLFDKGDNNIDKVLKGMPILSVSDRNKIELFIQNNSKREENSVLFESILSFVIGVVSSLTATFLGRLKINKFRL
jgi:hypothetical protein